MSSRTGKIQAAWNSTGSTLYAIVRNAIAEAWNVGGVTFESFNVANWSQYAVPMTEQGALSQFYVADLPAGAETYYTATVYEQAGIGPAVADTLVDVIRAAQLADDVPHGGVPGSSTATLALQQISLVSPTEHAVNIEAVANFKNAINVIAHGIIGTAAYLQGGDNSGVGFSINGGANSGDAVTISSNSGRGVYVSSTGGHAVELAPVDGDGLHIATGISAIPAAIGVSVVGAGTGPAVQIGDGGAGAAGLLIQAGPNDHAIHIIGGSTAGDGILIESLEKGLEINATGGGIVIQSDGTGISVQSGTDSAVFLGSSLLPTVALFAAIGNAVEVNSQQSVDFRGRHRILSSLTIGEDLLAFPFVMTDLAGNPKTGLTVTSTVSIDGAAAVPTVNSATEVGNGQYSIDLAASDRAGTTMMLRFTAPNARDLDIALINTA